jgi:hypothetical protein
MGTSENSKAKNGEANALFYYAISNWCGRNVAVKAIVVLS